MNHCTVASDQGEPIVPVLILHDLGAGEVGQIKVLVGIAPGAGQCDDEGATADGQRGGMPADAELLPREKDAKAGKSEKEPPREGAAGVSYNHAAHVRIARRPQGADHAKNREPGRAQEIGRAHV